MARPTTTRHACWKNRSTTAALCQRAATCSQRAWRVSQRRGWSCAVIATARRSFMGRGSVWFSIPGVLVAWCSRTFLLPQTWNTARLTLGMRYSRNEKEAGRSNSWPWSTTGSPHRRVHLPTTTLNGRRPCCLDTSNSRRLYWHPGIREQDRPVNGYDLAASAIRPQILPHENAYG